MSEELYDKIKEMQVETENKEVEKAERLMKLTEKFVTLAGLKPPHFTIRIGQGDDKVTVHAEVSGMFWNTGVGKYPEAPIFEVRKDSLRTLDYATKLGRSSSINPMPTLSISLVSEFPLPENLTVSEVDDMNTTPDIVKAIHNIFLTPNNLVPKLEDQAADD